MNSHRDDKGPAKSYGPYSPVKNSGVFSFISGQIGVNAETGRAEPDIAAQTVQAMENLKRLLENAGMSMRNLVKTTIFLTDMGDFQTVNGIYTQYFDSPRPARSCVGVKELPRVAGDVKLKIEIEAIAAISSPPKE